MKKRWIIWGVFCKKRMEGIKSRKWLISKGILEKEFLWKSTLTLKNKSSHYTDSFEICNLLSYSEQYQNYSKFDAKTYFSLLENMYKAGEKTFKVPYVTGNRINKSGYIWGDYTKEQMKIYLEKVYINAFGEYINLIDVFFGCFQEKLSMYVLLPCKMIGLLSYNDVSLDYYDSPRMKYYFVSLPKESSNCIEIQIVDDVGIGEKELNAIFNNMKKAAIKYRGKSADNMRYTIKSGKCFNASSTPVADVVYDLLIEDLKKIAWIKN